MNAGCKVCGASTGNYLCHACDTEWTSSPEWRRAAGQNLDDCPRPSDYRALVDFVNRRRAELRNGAGVGQ